ncbi:unnamed protein product, partial [Eretmochelys imbricata]
MEDLKIFKDELSHSDFEGKHNIPRGLLENADRIDIKNILMKFYGGDTAVHVTIDIFTQINLTDSAAKLREGREKDLHPKEKPSELSAKGESKALQREKMQPLSLVLTGSLPLGESQAQSMVGSAMLGTSTLQEMTH